MADLPAYAGFELYSDRRMLFFREPVAEDEGSLTLSYRIKESLPVLSRAFFVQYRVPVRRSSISIKAPGNWKIESAWLNGPGEGEFRADSSAYEWQSTEIGPLLEEPFSPPATDLVRQLLVRCREPVKDGDIWSFSSWDDVAEWFRKLCIPSVSVTPEISREAVARTQDAATRLEKIRRLYHFVQEKVRYVAVEIGIGGYQPYPAQQTLENRYGDCKDQAALLCALLKSIDINACPVLLRTRNVGRVNRDFPSPFQFNHCIVYIPASQYIQQPGGLSNLPEAFHQGIYLDATASVCPFGDLPQPDQEAWALVVSDTCGQLNKVASTGIQSNKTARKTFVELRANGSANCSVVEKHYGIENQYVRGLLFGRKSSDRQQYWARKINENFPRSGNVELSVENEKELSLPIEMQYRFYVRKYSQRSGELLISPAMYWKIFQKNPFHEPIRVNPVSLGHRRTVADTLLIAIPQGYVVGELPEPGRILKPFGEFNITYKVRDGRLIEIARTCSFSLSTVPRDQYDEVRAFIDSMIRQESERVVLKKS